jgi:hypothetical protein
MCCVDNCVRRQLTEEKCFTFVAGGCAAVRRPEVLVCEWQLPSLPCCAVACRSCAELAVSLLMACLPSTATHPTVWSTCAVCSGAVREQGCHGQKRSTEVQQCVKCLLCGCVCAASTGAMLHLGRASCECGIHGLGSLLLPSLVFVPSTVGPSLLLVRLSKGNVMHCHAVQECLMYGWCMLLPKWCMRNTQGSRLI